jgi:hypothetical protein
VLYGNLIIVGNAGNPTQAFTPVKRDGKWQMALARDAEGEAPTNHEQLRPLAWLVGDWVDDGQSALVFREPTGGTLDEPPPNAYLRYKAHFAGRARSTYGVRQVNLLFDNGGVRVPATLTRVGAAALGSAARPRAGAPTQASFVAEFVQRPRNIDRDTDVQVEILDGRGERTLLEGRWIWWGP